MSAVEKEQFLEMRAQQLAADEKRQEQVAARFDAGLAALRRLIVIAKSDTGQSRHVAGFLLAWWNADSCGRFDLTDLWAVDSAIADDMATVFRFVADHRSYPTAYGLGPDFEQLVAAWRPALLQ